MAQAIRIIDLTKDDLIQLIKEAIPLQKCPPCEQAKEVKELYTRYEAEELLGVSLTTLHKWAKDGTLTPSKIGGRVYYKREHIMNRLNVAA